MKTVHKWWILASFMTKVIRDTGTLVLIHGQLSASRTDQYNPLDIQNYLHKAKTWYHRPLQRTIWVFFYTLKILFRVQSTNTRNLTFQPFQLQLKNEHFLKVKVKCYSKEKNDSHWKVHIFYLMILMIDCKLDLVIHYSTGIKWTYSITSIKCFSITRGYK